jgi:hypothetical protein
LPSPPRFQLAPGPFGDTSESPGAKFSASQTPENPRNRERISRMRVRNAASPDFRSLAMKIDVDKHLVATKRRSIRDKKRQ